MDVLTGGDMMDSHMVRLLVQGVTTGVNNLTLSINSYELISLPPKLELFQQIIYREFYS